MIQMEHATMTDLTTDHPHVSPALVAAADQAGRAIPPVWPLASSVAVNPYLGQTRLDLALTAALLERVAGAPTTMPRDWYQRRIADSTITDDDLAAALAAAPNGPRPASVAALRALAHTPAAPSCALPTVAELAADASDIDWPAIIAERFGAWAGGYFDVGQALWAAPGDRGAYTIWRAAAIHDLTPEIAGLRGFARRVADSPMTAIESLTQSAQRLGINPVAATLYFHRLLITMGGWSQCARYRQWQAELAGGRNDTIIDFLAIHLIWEEALLDQYRGAIDEDWRGTLHAYAQPITPSKDHLVDAILQDAYERAHQRGLAATLANDQTADPAMPAAHPKPVLQAAFCIDVRSEVFRRALESLDPQVQTLGFAGFFGLGTAHRRFASDVLEHRLPVLLNAAVATRAGTTADTGADNAVRYRARATRAWGRFKLAAVSSFAFVEATGPIYVAKLVRDALGTGAKHPIDDPRPRFDPMPDLPTRTAMAESILRAMSLTRDFAPLVLLVGHGATVANNPHASALHCGACGGYSGEVNARLLAGLLNDSDVRTAVAATGIVIPDTTLFVAGLHDTTTDDVHLFPQDYPSPAHQEQLERAARWLEAAGAMARGERALRLPRASGAASIIGRSRNWAETRPEWGLARCKAFIAAPRERTSGKALQGRAFLHDYDWRQDDGFGVLELILTAPVVVASWISLQYYGSTVAPALFGGGNKLLHNVVGGIGVVEGNGGTLRAGLPLQSVHDGDDFVHDPLRLTVCVAAPRDAIAAILDRHPDVRALFDQRWMSLFALDDAGAMAWRYAGALQWKSTSATESVTRAQELAA